MPLDLPPPLPPQQAEAAVLEQRYEAAEDPLLLKVGRYRLLVSGNDYLSEERIREVTAAGRTPSQVILLLNALYAAEGYLLVNVQYARKGQTDTIYVQVNEGYLAEVDAPPAVEPFFEGFEGERGLTETDVEPMRILAELKAERAGYNLSTSYTIDPDNPAAFTLVIDGQEDPNHDPFEFTVAFGNPGNRFLGRYFGLSSLKIDTPDGNQIGLGYATGFTELGSSRGGEDYDRYDLSYTLISSWGLYSLSGSYTKYEVSDLFATDDSDPVRIEGDVAESEISEVRLAGNQFLYADDDTRWVLEQQLEYVDSTIELTAGNLVVEDQDGNGTADGPLGGLLGGVLDDLLGGVLTPGTPSTAMAALAGQSIQDEHYYAARLGTTVSDSWSLFGKRGSISLGGGYKRGLGGEIENTFTDRERQAQFDLLDADFSVNYQMPWQMLLSLDAKAQFSLDDRVPQQQQFVLGGPGNLSAYLPGILVGDTGTFASLALQLPRWQLFSRPYRFSLFVETGSAKFEGPNPPLRREGTARATDAGIKLEFAPFDFLQITAYTAVGLSESGLSDEVVERNESDAYFNIKATF